MLDSPLDLHQAFPCDRNALQVHHPHKLDLPDSPGCPDLPDIMSDRPRFVLLNLLFRSITPSEPKLVHFFVYFIQYFYHNGTENSPFIKKSPITTSNYVLRNCYLPMFFLKFSDVPLHENLQFPVCRARVVLRNKLKLPQNLLICPECKFHDLIRHCKKLLLTTF